MKHVYVVCLQNTPLSVFTDEAAAKARRDLHRGRLREIKADKLFGIQPKDYWVRQMEVDVA